MIAADLTRDDIGAEVEFTIGELTVYGRLKTVTHMFGMVRLILDNDGTETSFLVDREEHVTVTYEHARFRALTEEDPTLRGTFLHEVNHLAVLNRVHQILGDDQ